VLVTGWGKSQEHAEQTLGRPSVFPPSQRITPSPESQFPRSAQALAGVSTTSPLGQQQIEDAVRHCIARVWNVSRVVGDGLKEPARPVDRPRFGPSSSKNIQAKGESNSTPSLCHSAYPDPLMDGQFESRSGPPRHFWCSTACLAVLWVIGVPECWHESGSSLPAKIAMSFINLRWPRRVAFAASCLTWRWCFPVASLIGFNQPCR